MVTYLVIMAVIGVLREMYVAMNNVTPISKISGKSWAFAVSFGIWAPILFVVEFVNAYKKVYNK